MFGVVREADFEELPEIEWEYNLTDRILKYLDSQNIKRKTSKDAPDSCCSVESLIKEG